MSTSDTVSERVQVTALVYVQAAHVEEPNVKDDEQRMHNRSSTSHLLSPSQILENKTGLVVLLQMCLALTACDRASASRSMSNGRPNMIAGLHTCCCCRSCCTQRFRQLIGANEEVSTHLRLILDGLKG